MSAQKHNFLPKLHLGCGEIYLDGYTNIDFATSKAQGNCKPDIIGDFTKLTYPENYFDEIYLSHVFEHFPRWQAFNLLIQWNKMLKKDGVLRIEVPDTEESMLQYFRSNSIEFRMKVLRHMYGSHEDKWAVHWEGWTVTKLHVALEACGFANESRVDKNGGGWNPAVEVTALKKGKPDRNKIEYYFTVIADGHAPTLKNWLKLINL
jgi:predicted SAM-dependent methyltransferase